MADAPHMAYVVRCHHCKAITDAIIDNKSRPLETTEHVRRALVATRRMRGILEYLTVEAVRDQLTHECTC